MFLREKVENLPVPVSLLDLPVEVPTYLSYLSVPTFPSPLLLPQYDLAFSHLDPYASSQSGPPCLSFALESIITLQSKQSLSNGKLGPASAFGNFPSVTGHTHPPYPPISHSPFCPSPPTLHVASGHSTHAHGSSVFLKCFAPSCLPSKLLVAL